MFPFKKVYKGGAPWIDYKEEGKTAYKQVFIFQLKNMVALVLNDICITYPCAALGVSRPMMRATIELVSTSNKYIPFEIPENLFSSPCQNYRLGVLNEPAQGMRLQPVYFHFICDYGDTIKVTIQGTGTGFTVGCKLSGQQYRGGEWGLL
jgi:hypothetical protein